MHFARTMNLKKHSENSHSHTNFNATPAKLQKQDKLQNESVMDKDVTKYISELD